MICQIFIPHLAGEVSNVGYNLNEFLKSMMIEGRFTNRLPSHVFNVTDYCTFSKEEQERIIPAIGRLVPPGFKDVSVVRVPKLQCAYLHQDPHRECALDIPFSVGCEDATHIMHKSMHNGEHHIHLSTFQFDRMYALAYRAKHPHRIDNTKNKHDLLYLSYSYDQPLIHLVENMI